MPVSVQKLYVTIFLAVLPSPHHGKVGREERKEGVMEGASEPDGPIQFCTLPAVQTAVSWKPLSLRFPIYTTRIVISTTRVRLNEVSCLRCSGEPRHYSRCSTSMSCPPSLHFFLCQEFQLGQHSGSAPSHVWC